MKINHYGFATADLDKSKETYLELGYHIASDQFIDDIQQVKILFLRREHGALIELVQPTNKDSPVTNILNKMGNSLYHTCFEVEDLASDIIKLKRQKFLLVSQPVPAIAFDNELICFMYHTSIGLIELTQRKA